MNPIKQDKKAPKLNPQNLPLEEMQQWNWKAVKKHIRNGFNQKSEAVTGFLGGKIAPWISLGIFAILLLSSFGVIFNLQSLSMPVVILCWSFALFLFPAGAVTRVFSVSERGDTQTQNRSLLFQNYLFMLLFSFGMTWSSYLILNSAAGFRLNKENFTWSLNADSLELKKINQSLHQVQQAHSKTKTMPLLQLKQHNPKQQGDKVTAIFSWSKEGTSEKKIDLLTIRNSGDNPIFRGFLVKYFCLSTFEMKPGLSQSSLLSSFKEFAERGENNDEKNKPNKVALYQYLTALDKTADLDLAERGLFPYLRMLNGPIQLLIFSFFVLIVFKIKTRHALAVEMDRKTHRLGKQLVAIAYAAPIQNATINKNQHITVILEWLAKEVRSAQSYAPCNAVRLLESGFRSLSLGGGIADKTTEELNATVETLKDEIAAKASIVSFILWLMPMLGFLGTVMGIMEALPQTGETQHFDKAQALAGRGSVVSGIGVAFDTTFVGLVFVIFGTFMKNYYSEFEERYINHLRQDFMADYVNAENILPTQAAVFSIGKQNQHVLHQQNAQQTNASEHPSEHEAASFNQKRKKMGLIFSIALLIIFSLLIWYFTH